MLVVEVQDDASKLLAYFDALGLVPILGRRGWTHMGAVLSDAALQRRAHYRRVVEPRVRELMAAWPDADTVSGFASRLATDDVGTVLRWRPGSKLLLLRSLTLAMQELGIETTVDLCVRLTDTDSSHVRDRLRAIHGVGPKTIDYLAILAGSEKHVAVDSHLQSFAKEAGVLLIKFQALSDTIRTAAARRCCTPGAMDAAIWHYMSHR
jgi:hypothetical protein